MKNIIIRISLIAGLLLTAHMPVAGQIIEWRSTSTIQDLHSGYTPLVTKAEAEKAKLLPMSSTSIMMETGEIPTPYQVSEEEEAMYAQARRRAFGQPGDPGNKSNEFPIGEPWVMLLMAGVMAMVIRRRLVRSTIAKNATVKTGQQLPTISKNL